MSIFQHSFEATNNSALWTSQVTFLWICYCCFLSLSEYSSLYMRVFSACVSGVEEQKVSAGLACVGGFWDLP